MSAFKRRSWCYCHWTWRRST